MSQHGSNSGIGADEAFARNFAAARMRKGLSQDEVARVVGMHQTAIGKIERGERRVAIGEARDLANVVDVPLDVLIGDAWRNEVLYKVQLVENAARSMREAMREFRQSQFMLAMTAGGLDELDSDADLSAQVERSLRYRPETALSEVDRHLARDFDPEATLMKDPDRYLRLYVDNIEPNFFDHG